MSRLKPWAKSRAGAPSGPAARTTSSVPSADRTVPRSWGGSVPRASPASGSLRARKRRTASRSATMAAAPTAAVAPTPTASLRSLRRRVGAAGRPLSRSGTVLSGNPLAHGADDLVADGPRPTGHLLRGDELSVLLAEQHHLVPPLHAIVAAVHHQLVHGHRPGHRVALPADQHLAPSGQRPEVAVGVAHRDRGDRGIPLRGVPEAVGDPLPRGHPLDQGHPGP